MLYIRADIQLESAQLLCFFFKYGLKEASFSRIFYFLPKRPKALRQAQTGIKKRRTI